jgi:hypothetical protein
LPSHTQYTQIPLKENGTVGSRGHTHIQVWGSYMMNEVKANTFIRKE